MLSLAIGCTSQKVTQLPENQPQEIKIYSSSAEIDKHRKDNRSDEEIAATIKADNAAFDAFMNKEDENGSSLGGLIEFWLTIWQISRFP